MRTSQPIAFGRGVNLGGWLNGSAGPERLHHHQTFITQADFVRIAEWGFDNVRVPFDFALIADEASGRMLESGLAWIDQALSWAESAQLKVVLDMHRLPGYSFIDGAEKPGQVPPLFTVSAKQAFFYSIWRNLAERYQGRFDGVAFELANEIAAPTGAQWNDLAAEATATIREVDSARAIVVGSNCWNVCSTYPEMAVIEDPNIIYNFHFYNPFTFTHQAASWAPELMYYGKAVSYPGKSAGLYAAAERAEREGKHHLVAGLRSLGDFFEERISDKSHLRELMSPTIDFAKAHNVPLYCGEFGVIKTAPHADAMRWYTDVLELFVEHDIAWSLWSYKDGNFPLVDAQGGLLNPDLLELASGK